jgi:hypothetical protein
MKAKQILCVSYSYMQERTCSDSLKMDRHSVAEACKEKLLATGLTKST